MCDSLVARADRTLDGATIFAKNSDRRGREPQPFIQFPAAFHSRGTRLRCTHVEIDQVAETYRVMGHSPDWCWGFEQGVNEYGVAIGNQAVWTREPPETEPGLIGMDLVRLGLERGRSAREALEIIAALLETRGQGGSAFAADGDPGYQNSFLIADGASAWVLETTARSWAAREVESASMTNELSLEQDWQIGSRQLERAAIQNGLWTGPSRLDFRKAFQAEGWPPHLTRQRHAASRKTLERPALTVSDLLPWLRDHGDAQRPRLAEEELSTGAGFSICMHADPVATTTASLAVRLPRAPGARPWPVFISFATPCTSLFIPVYLDGVLPAAMASSLVWESMRRLQDQAARDWERTLPVLREGWRGLERKIESERERIEEEAAQHFAEEADDAGAEILTAFMSRVTDQVLAKASELSRALSRAVSSVI